VADFEQTLAVFYQQKLLLVGSGGGNRLGGINSRNADKVESRFVKLNFSYKFSNRSVKASPRRDTGIEAEKSRLDN
jgi:hypothetical protein